MGAFEDFFAKFGAQKAKADPSTFNYSTASDKIQRQRATASQLLKDGRMPENSQLANPGGFVVPVGGAQILGKMLQSYLGNKQMESADGAQNELEKNSRDAFMQQYGHLKDEAPMSPDEAKQFERQQAIAQADAQQRAEQEAARQSGVTASVPATNPAPADQPAPPMPTKSISSQPVAPIGASSSSPQSTFDEMGNVTGFENSVPPSSAKPDLRAMVKALTGNNKFSAADINALPPALTQGASPAGAGRGSVNPPMVKAAANALQGLPQAQMQSEPVASVDAATSKLMPASDPQFVPAPSGFVGPQEPPVQSHNRAPNQAELLGRLYDLSKTGPMGQAIAQSELDKLSPKAHEYDIKDGVMFDKRTGDSKQVGPHGQPIDTPNGMMRQNPNGTLSPVLDQTGKQVMGKEGQAVSEKNADTEASYQQSKSDYGIAAARLNNILSNPSIIENAAGGVMNNMKGAMPLPTDVSAARSSVKEAVNGMVMGAIKSMKTAGVGTGAFNSDAESARLQSALADVDFTHLDSKALTAKIASLYTQSQDALARLDTVRAAKVPAQQQTTPKASSTGGRGVMKFE